MAVSKTIGRADVTRARKLLEEYKLGDYKLNVIQGSHSDSVLLLNRELSSATLSSEAKTQKLIEQSEQLNQLADHLAQYTHYETLGKEIGPEVKAVFPSVTAVSLSNATEVRTDTAVSRRYIIALVNSRSRLVPAERIRLHRWLKARTKADSLRLVTAM